MSATPARRETVALTEIAAAIQVEHTAAQDAFRSAVGHAVRCGELLASAKAQVPHGGWAGWLAENFPAGQRTAQGYMRLAHHAEDAQALAHLGIEGALKQLSAPKADPGDRLGRAADYIEKGDEAFREAHEAFREAGVVFHATGLELPDDLSFEDWQRLGAYLRRFVTDDLLDEARG